MKFGLQASKELSEFFREKSNFAEQNSKLMSKLAHKYRNSNQHVCTNMDMVSKTHFGYQSYTILYQLIFCIYCSNLIKFSIQFMRLGKYVREGDGKRSAATPIQLSKTSLAQKSGCLININFYKIKKQKHYRTKKHYRTIFCYYVYKTEDGIFSDATPTPPYVHIHQLVI